MKRGRKPIPHVFVDGVEHKRCWSCRQPLPLDQFYKSSKKHDGLAASCIPCSRAYRKAYEDRCKRRTPSTKPQRCSKCLTTKPASEFYPCITKPNGLASYCKACSRAYTGARAKTERVRAVRRVWAATKGKKVVRQYVDRWPAKKRAQTELQIAVKAGEIVKPSECSACRGTERIEAHHDDYAFSLEVRWLCRWCHRAWHREHGPGRNSDLMIPREYPNAKA